MVGGGHGDSSVKEKKEWIRPLIQLSVLKKRKRSEVSKDIIPYVDPGVQQQDYPQSDSLSKNLNDQVESVYASKKREVKKSRAKKKKVKVDPSDDDFVEHIESGTSSKVPIEKKIQPTARVVDSDAPNPPMKPEHRFASKLQIWNNPWVIEELNGNLTPSQKALFLTTPFSQFLKMGNIKWNIALPHLALVRKVHQGREDLEKWFLIRDRVVRFGLEEFVLITGLSPEGSSDLNEFKQKMSFKKKMFPDLTIKFIQELVRARFLSGEFDDDVDAVKMAIKPVVSKSKLPEYDDDEGGLQLSLVREDKIVSLIDSLTRAYASPISAKNDQWDLVSILESASPVVDDDVEVLDVLPLQSSVAAKRQAKPELHYKSPFVNEFGSFEPKDQNKKEKQPSSELDFDPKELSNEKIAGDIDPPFDFSIAQIDDKSWFVILQTCGEELFDLHLNATLYYLSKSILFDASVNKRVMTTCTYNEH
ncbi:hypothetical protein F8388_008745 [Cannabis sativa]|uniref:Uncharacterized protein n=1 Tax=Cannabis sativa TaxID=3483 RepID=A0A7J6HK79_CANSA|nr:hypothetical protein F8388_008745 [Cannabis sativa]